MVGYRKGLLLGVAVWLLGIAQAQAALQSDAASRQSEASLSASLEVPIAMTVALSEGGRFVVTAVQASGTAALVTVSAIGHGTSAAIVVSSEIVRRLGIAAGSAVVVTAVATGWILSVAGESLCYVANVAVRPYLHSRRITP